MKIDSYILPFLILLLLIYSAFKKQNLYLAFTKGIKSAVRLIFDIFPYVSAILIMVNLLTESGVLSRLIDLLTPFCHFLGIDGDLIYLIIIKPFSGSGSIAVLDDIFTKFGVDSLKAKTASVIFGSSETVFFVAGIYLSKCKNKKLTLPIIFALIATFFSSIFACLLCKIIF